MNKKTIIKTLSAVALSSLLITTSFNAAFAHELGSNKKPLSFGNDQTTIDLTKIVWAPLVVEGLAPGAEIAVLRGDLGTGVSESLLKLPPNYSVPNHNHSSDELYVWMQGAFTMTAYDGTETSFDGPAYISFPGNNPPHALKCGPKESCILFLRYERPFDINYFDEANPGEMAN